MGNYLLHNCCLVLCIVRSCCSKYRNTATGALLTGSSEVFRDYLDLQCDFQYKAKPVYPKQKGERRSRTALLKTSLPFQGERGDIFKRKKSLGKIMLVTPGNPWVSFASGFWWSM